MSNESNSKLTPQRLADFAIPRDCRISPDGYWVVYAFRPFWTRAKEYVTSSLWLAEIGQEDSARQLTQGNYNDASPVFSPDGKHIAFLSDRASPGNAAAIYLMPLNGGEALPLTGSDHEKGVVSFQFSPDGKEIAYLSADGEAENPKKKNENNDDAKVYGEEWEFNRLRLVNLESREVSTLVAKNAQISSFAWSPNRDKLVYAEQISPALDDLIRGSTIRIINRRDGSTVTVCYYKSLVNNLIWHQDEMILWEGKVHEEHLVTSSAVCGVAAKENAQHQRIMSGIDECGLSIRACGKDVVAYVQRGLSDELQTLSSETIYSEQVDISMIGRGWDALVEADDRIVVVIKGNSEYSPNLFSIKAGNSIQLSNHNEDIAALKLGQDRLLAYRTQDNLPLDGVLCTPQSLADKKGPHPTVVLPHGGPYSRVTIGSDPCFNWVLWLCSLGYIVLLPNYRGGSSHGQKYAESCQGHIDTSYQDVISLTQKCISDGIVDENRVAIAGWSQGGYLSYLAVTRDTTFHFAAAVCGAGVSDWNMMAMASDIPLFQIQLAGAAPWQCGDGAAENRNASPIYHMQDIETPCLILHGEEDMRIPKEQAIGFYRGMMSKGKDCEMVLYPREGHGLPMPFEQAHYIHMLSKMENFLEKYLK